MRRWLLDISWATVRLPVLLDRFSRLTLLFVADPSKICTLLQIILMVGYGTIDCIVGGQVLSAVSGGSMSIAVGVVIIAVLECLIASFGLKVFHYYER